MVLSTVAEFSFCGGYNTGCASDNCCIYVSASKCGPRISINSQICVPKTS